MNRDGQMYQLLCMDYPALAPKFRSVAFQDGLPASAKWVREGILNNYEGRKMKDEVKKKTAKKSIKKPPVKKKSAKKASDKRGAKK